MLAAPNSELCQISRDICLNSDVRQILRHNIWSLLVLNIYPSLGAVDVEDTFWGICATRTFCYSADQSRNISPFFSTRWKLILSSRQKSIYTKREWRKTCFFCEKKRILQQFWPHVISFSKMRNQVFVISFLKIQNLIELNLLGRATDKTSNLDTPPPPLPQWMFGW